MRTSKTARRAGGLIFIVITFALVVLQRPKSAVDLPQVKAPLASDTWNAEALLAQYYPAPARTPNTPPKYQPIAATRDGFEPPADMQKLIDNPGSRWKNPAKAVQPVFPKSFAGPVRVRCASADVSAIPIGANLQSSGEIAADGSLIYRDAFGPGIDVAYRCEAIKTEEFIVIRDVARASAREAASRGSVVTGDEWRVTGGNSARATAVLPLSSEERGPGGEVRAVTQFSWDLQCGGLKPRLTPGHTIEFCDEQGVPRLRINAPEGKDVAGKLLRAGEQLKLSLDGERLTLACDLSRAKFPVVIDPSWSTTGAMAVARYAHQSVVLNSGNVLVTGGNGPSTSVELYDVATQTWSSLPNMNQARDAHTSTLLSDGTVLTVGGYSFDAYGTAERFDPATAVWHTTPNPLFKHRQHTATLLNDGTLIVTGMDSSVECEIFSPTSNSWSATGSLAAYHGEQRRAALLPDGSVLVVGGMFSPESELYNAQSGTWAVTSAMQRSRFGHTLTVLNSGDAIVVGGKVPTATAECEIFSPSTSQWRPAGRLNFATSSHTATLLHSGKVMIAGGDFSGNGDATANCEIYDPAVDAFTGTSALSTARFSHTANFLANGSAIVIGGIGLFSIPLASCELFDPNSAPILQAGVTPTGATPSQNITFSAQGTDPDGDTLTYLWDFGDGATSTEQNATHAYAAVGSYTAMVTVTDAAGGMASATVLIQVSKAPTGRVTTSDVVAFGSLPFTFDASTSTDPENAIVSYEWNFGDGSPNGSGQVISKIYEQPGTYTVTLTITDAAGVSTTVTRLIEVLPGNQAGLYNGFVDYKVGWNRLADSKDTLTLNASVNVGDDGIGKDTPVAVEIVGQRFTGTLDLKLRDYSDANAKWTVKANVRKQPAGTVLITLKVKNANLGLGFNQLGVIGNGDPSDIVEKDIPVRLEIGTRSFEVLVPSEFKFNAAGQKARGEGDS
ncbi:MAG TPA: PKD domain-containing protein [Planctomycetota bacterium]|nr:PKD domain-containing protein [Planctomycetota bacterium]